MYPANLKEKRVVLIHWKGNNEVEVFSNLKNFCLSYPQYNYNTLNNYLSNGKIAYENETIKVERKQIIARPKPLILERNKGRKIAHVARKVPMKEANDEQRDLQYWLSQPVKKRAEATTFLISQMLKKGQRMDKGVVNKIKIEK